MLHESTMVKPCLVYILPVLAVKSEYLANISSTKQLRRSAFLILKKCLFTNCNKLRIYENLKQKFIGPSKDQSQIAVFLF